MSFTVSGNSKPSQVRLFSRILSPWWWRTRLRGVVKRWSQNPFMHEHRVVGADMDESHGVQWCPLDLPDPGEDTSLCLGFATHQLCSLNLRPPSLKWDAQSPPPCRACQEPSNTAHAEAAWQPHYRAALQYRKHSLDSIKSKHSAITEYVSKARYYAGTGNNKG